MRSTIATILRRRAGLQHRFDIAASFDALEESCVPSYCHGNPAAALVAWLRPVAAARLWARHAPPGPVLDFGAATGELFHFLKVARPDAVSAYHIIEVDDLLAEAALEFIPEARRQTLDSLADRSFSAIFAFDSLEHNDDVDGLVKRLVPGLVDDGVFILSGPTENALYRLGRRIAGFDGHYHTTTIHHIESVCAGYMRCLERRRVPVGLPLFSVSAWQQNAAT